MQKSKQLPEMQSDQMERLIEVIDILCFDIELLKNGQYQTIANFLPVFIKYNEN